jgi:L,D-peptidoglycan transpeptidase YkuD (ErfK/YbiS/YcfS/YnhG family)
MPHNIILVRGNQLSFSGKTYRCAIGKGGFSTHKKEGDGATPTGVFPLRECWYRADRIKAPKIALPLIAIHQDDGWCDDPKSLDYNLPVKLPFEFSHEKLWRDDSRYDLIVPLGYNDGPIVAGKGSAIFLHIASDNYSPTEGCVAVSQSDLLEILSKAGPQTAMDIRES